MSDWDKANLSKSEIKQLEQYGNDYKNAGNTAAKTAAHANAEALRDKYRSSNEVGTSDGHTITISSNSGSTGVGGSSSNTSTPIEQPKQSPKPMESEDYSALYSEISGLTATNTLKGTGTSVDKSKNTSKVNSGTYSPINIMAGDRIVGNAVVKGGVSYGNIRDLVEGLGGNVTWDSNTGIATATIGDKTIIYYTKDTTKDSVKKKAWTFEVVKNGKSVKFEGSNTFGIIQGKTQVRVAQFYNIFGLEKDLDYSYFRNDKNEGVVLIRPSGLAANDKLARSNIIEWTKELTGSNGYYFNDFGQLKYDAPKDGKNYKPFSETADAMLKAAINSKNFIFVETPKIDELGCIAPELGDSIENMAAGGFYYGDTQLYSPRAMDREGRHARVWMNPEYIKAGPKEVHNAYSKDTIYTPLSTDFVHELSHAIRWNAGFNDTTAKNGYPNETEAWAVYTQNTIITELQKSAKATDFNKYWLRTDGNEGYTRDKGKIIDSKESILIPGLETYNTYGKFSDKKKVFKDINDTGSLANYITQNYK